MRAPPAQIVAVLDRQHAPDGLADTLALEGLVPVPLRWAILRSSGANRQDREQDNQEQEAPNAEGRPPPVPASPKPPSDHGATSLPLRAEDVSVMLVPA